MDLITLILVVVLLFVLTDLLWKFLPISPTFKGYLAIVVVIILLIWLLRGNLGLTF
jgi:hypothetical protein